MYVSTLMIMGTTKDFHITASDSDFRSVRLGDINLLSIISEDDVVEYRVIQKHSGRARIERFVTGRRRTHHAKIFPSQEIFTLIRYEGRDFAQVRVFLRPAQRTHF